MMQRTSFDYKTAMHNVDELPKLDILGVKVAIITTEQLHLFIQDVIGNNGKSVVPHVNVHGVNLALQHPWLRDFFNSASIVFCDGAGIQLGAKILGYTTLPERITYANWMWQLAELAQSKGYSLFLLGGASSVAERAAMNLLARFPRLRIAGTHHGYFEKTGTENARIISLINSSQTDILVVGFGMPLQERWLRDYWPELDVHIALTGGAVFDYISGNLHRGPRWMTEYGFEWLARLAIEPSRLWRRYILGNPHFLYRVLQQSFSLSRPQKQ